jgi:hypothetical protein
VTQREKLEEIEKRCDSIDSNLTETQKSINKLGSFFGGIKNYFQPPKTAFPKSMSQPQLSSAAKKKAEKTQIAAANAVVSRPTKLNDNTDTYFGKARHDMDDIERETEEGLRK